MNIIRFPLDCLFLCFVFSISANGLIVPIGRNFEIAQIIFFILIGFVVNKIVIGPHNIKVVKSNHTKIVKL